VKGRSPSVECHPSPFPSPSQHLRVSVHTGQAHEKENQLDVFCFFLSLVTPPLLSLQS
jgi:hypothetical protein